MSWIDLLSQIVKLALSLWSYFRGQADEKTAALKAIADQFMKLEQAGYPIMRDILVQMGRSSWIPWDQIPDSASTSKGGPSNVISS